MLKLEPNERLLYSPGPWALDYELPPNPRSVIARTTGGLPISANTVGPHDPAHDANNARIISLAPEMLEAIVMIEACFQTWEEQDTETLADIAEASGVREAVANIVKKLRKSKK
jgi:hypothetical protein